MPIQSCSCSVEEASTPLTFVRRLRSAARLLDSRQRFAFAGLIAERVAVGICDLLLATAMYFLFLLLQGGSASHHFRWAPKTTLSAALIAGALVVVRALIDLFSTRAVVSYVQHLYKDFLLQLTRGYSAMSWNRFVERNRTELLNHSIHTVREAANFYQYSIDLAATVVVVTAMTAALVYQSTMAACGLGAALVLFYGVHWFLLRKRVQLAASDRELSLRSLQRTLAGMFASGKEIRTYGNEEFFHRRIAEQAEHLAQSNRRLSVPPQIARILSDQGVLLLFLCVVVAVQLRHGDIRHLLSLLVFYFVLSRRLLPLISQMSYLAGQMEGTCENVGIVDLELNECRKYRTLPLSARLPDTGMVLQMNHVSFSFPGGAPILRNMDLAIRGGETIVLYGPSGIGKSSLLNLIAGVSQPVTGEVRVDRARIAYVPQEIPLLDDSIRNNLLFGLPTKNYEELMKALVVARLDEFVAAQPFGLDTGVGDNGSLFSGGERQRLGIARAFLRGGQVLLLDEATSGLDQACEQQILENLAAYGKSVLLVTHRAHARSFAHRVFRLESGVLIEETSPGSAIREVSFSANSEGSFHERRLVESY